MSPEYWRVLILFCSSTYSASAKGEKRPMYELTETECLYVATKFNDEARARLILRWEELEQQAQQQLAAY
ncbi:MAG: Rha family transcriptional regulator [Bacteroidales bacterium]|nr:Rha family transcriptional regulator [Bacteroidales bacterium]MDD4362479.1 Rha family transcriptional regulator [Bacteroidales bacterium]